MENIKDYTHEISSCHQKIDSLEWEVIRLKFELATMTNQRDLAYQAFLQVNEALQEVGFGMLKAVK